METEYVLCKGETLFLYIIYMNIIFQKSVKWFRRTVAACSMRRPRFNPRMVNARFVVDEVVLGQVLLPVIRFSVGIIPPVLHTYLHLNLPQSNTLAGTSPILIKQEVVWVQNRSGRSGKEKIPLPLPGIES